MALVVDTAVCARRVKALYAAWQVRAVRLGACGPPSPDPRLNPC